MKPVQWNELELDEITDWPLLPQALVLLVVSCILMVAGYWYFVLPEKENLMNLQRTEADLRTQFVRRANQVSALPEVKEQLDELNLRYADVLEQLPVESELATLLSDINDIGVSNGLSFQRIQWAPRIQHGLYYELPIQLELSGGYEEIGRFTADVAHLSRIVTLSDFKLSVVKQVGKKVTLSLSVKAKTYRFKAIKELS
jgi:type IV pilus assembly protein PilO